MSNNAVLVGVVGSSCRSITPTRVVGDEAVRSVVALLCCWSCFRVGSSPMLPTIAVVVGASATTASLDGELLLATATLVAVISHCRWDM